MSTTVDLGKITASVTVGTTTTGAAGTNASVSNSGTTQDAVLNFTIPRGAQGVQGPQGSTGPQGPAGPTGPQGPMGDVAVITPEQQAAFTMYSVPGQNTDGPMTQKAVTDALVAEAISYDNSQSGLSSTNVQGAIDELPHVAKDSNDGLDIADATGNVILKMHKGDMQTKNFNSKNITSYYDDTNADLAFSDEDGNEIVQFSGGHIKTRLFDSSIGSGGSSTKSIKVLFLGNSVTQDHATYLPFLFKNTFGNSVAFEFYIYYIGGSGGTIKSYATNVINGDINADIFSVARNTDVWTNTTGTPIADAITMAEFDVISVAGWANPTYEDITYLPTLLRWLTDHSLKPFELAWLMTQTPTAYPTLSITYARQALEDYPISMLFPPALATEYARIAWGDSYINESGHNREGLPCMLTAYTIFINLCRRIGIPDKVLGSKLRMTTSIWNTLNIPGANGSVESTIDETKYFQAQNFAVMSVNAADSIFNDAKKETFNNLTI